MKDTLLYMANYIIPIRKSILIIHTNPSDIGKVIGKSGRIIRALRDLMKVLAAKANTFVDVEIAEDAAPQEVSA